MFWWDLWAALLWKIKVELEKNGIQIPFPQRELWFDNTLKTDMKTVQPPPIREVPYQEADDHLEVGKPRPGETHDW